MDVKQFLKNFLLNFRVFDCKEINLVGRNLFGKLQCAENKGETTIRIDGKFNNWVEQYRYITFAQGDVW